MHLVIDVGNTETVLGVFEPGQRDPKRTWRITTTVPRTRDEYRILLRELLRDESLADSGLKRAVLGSVVPSVTAALAGACEALADEVVIVEAGAELPITLDVDEPRTVGADRIVNTLAAAQLYGRDTLAVDLGTATTFDCITADAVFQGGVIAPGIMAGLEWLGRRAAKLPKVELAPPEKVIGRRTETCIQSGVFYGAIDAVDGIVDRILAEWGRPDPIVVATGGYATVVGPRSRTIQTVEPHLTLIGLRIAGDVLSSG
jgi:type III pantothenate kinase